MKRADLDRGQRVVVLVGSVGVLLGVLLLLIPFDVEYQGYRDVNTFLIYEQTWGGPGLADPLAESLSGGCSSPISEARSSEMRDVQIVGQATQRMDLWNRKQLALACQRAGLDKVYLPGGLILISVVASAVGVRWLRA